MLRNGYGMGMEPKIAAIVSACEKLILAASELDYGRHSRLADMAQAFAEHLIRESDIQGREEPDSLPDHRTLELEQWQPTTKDT